MASEKPTMMTRTFEVYVTLKGFRYSGDNIEFAAGIKIVRFTEFASIDNFKKFVSDDEWKDAINSSYWLLFEWNEGDINTTSETMNLVLLSLWLVKPNRVEVSLKFKVGKNGSKGESSRNRILDRMQWITKEENEIFSEEDILSASAYYSAFRNVYNLRGRLRNAMVLTLNGCWSHFWQVALISHAAAVEAILTYSKKPGLTNRLALSYACLTEKERTNRDEAYQQFVKLYSIRSDAIHGRVYNVGKNDRLPSLSRFQKLLRNLWHKVLSDNTTIVELDKSDEKRKIFFCELTKGYTAPNR
jgi:hypothetical protein